MAEMNAGRAVIELLRAEGVESHRFEDGSLVLQVSENVAGTSIHLLLEREGHQWPVSVRR